MDEIKIETTQDAAAVAVPEKRSIWHKLFGTTPGDGEMQPKEGIVCAALVRTSSAPSSAPISRCS